MQPGEGEAQSLSFIVNKIWNEAAQQHEKDEKKYTTNRTIYKSFSFIYI